MVAETQNVPKQRSGFGLNELLGARLPQTMTARKSGLGTEAGRLGAPRKASVRRPRSHADWAGVGTAPTRRPLRPKPGNAKPQMPERARRSDRDW